MPELRITPETINFGAVTQGEVTIKPVDLDEHWRARD